MSIPESAQTGMRATNARFSSSVIKQKQFEALDDVYTADARVLPPGSDLVQGRAQIKVFWQQAVEGLGVTDVKLTTVSAEAAGDSIIEVGRADLTLKESQIVTVKYVVQWKQEGGTWKWHTDIWNMNR